MGTNSIPWYSKKQTITEVEYLRTTDCIKKEFQTKNLLDELFGKTKTKDIYRDNEASKSIIKASHLSPKYKYISISYHFNHGNILNKNVKIY